MRLPTLTLTPSQKFAAKVALGKDALQKSIDEQARLYHNFWEQDLDRGVLPTDEQKQDILDGLNGDYVTAKAFFYAHYQLATQLNASAEYAGITTRVPAVLPSWISENGTTYELTPLTT